MSVKITPDIKQLYNAIICLKNPQEVQNFFDDLLTVPELLSLSQRLEVARLLNQGLSYDEIVNKTGASTATISRVKRCLIYGADGYTNVLKKLSR